MLGYGTAINETYQEHLDVFLEKSHKFNFVILSGGFTNHKIPDSEARVMKSYFEKRASFPPVILEERSRSKVENLLYSRRILKNLIGWGQKIEIVIFCRNPWRPKVRLLSFLVLSRIKGITGLEVVGTSKEALLRDYIKQVIIIPVDIISLFFPPINRWKIKIKKILIPD